MAGGVGSRFWPMSKTSKPKQFIDVLGTGRSLLQATYDRFLRICPPQNIFIVTHESYENMVADQLPELHSDNILLEPARRNTAPCIAYASYKIFKTNPNANVVVAPADHIITKEDTFVRAIKSCYAKSKSGDYLMTIGVKPTRPDTGYGYIQYREPDAQERDDRIKKVKTFTEKPDLEMAKQFVQSGDFLWNSGIFIFSVKAIIKAFEKFEPEMAETFKEGIAYYNTPDERSYLNKIYNTTKNISIDYAVMEKAENVFVRSSVIGWSDLGTWGSLYDHIKKDEKGNAVVGKNVMMYSSSNCIVNVSKDKLVVIEGLDDYIVVESDNTILICKKQDEQQIRNFVNDVKVSKGERFV